MVSMLNAADTIFYSSEMAEVRGFGLSVGDVVIYESSAGGSYPVPGDYPGGNGAVNYLETFSAADDISRRLKSACLAVAFNHRDFDGGTLGLAWVGSPSQTGAT